MLLYKVGFCGRRLESLQRVMAECVVRVVAVQEELSEMAFGAEMKR